MVLFFTLLFAVHFLTAQIPANYYSSADGKTGGAVLKTELYSIISSGYVTKSYDFLYTIYETSDNTADGNVWDMYSFCTWYHGVKKCGNYSKVCDCYNREHSIPQSWFNSQSPMDSDAFHVYPTDGYVNNQRGNLPFGECAGGTTLPNGKGRKGSSTFSGYTGTVFEPVDEYKGDFARTYFYFATRYQNKMTSISGESFNQTTYPSFSSWTINLFLKWHRNDPVSQKEIDRNNAIYVYQKNRNPYIDYPELAEYIWGNKVGQVWYSSTSGIEATSLYVQVAPNPAQEYITLTVSSIDGGMYVIYSLSGQKLLSGQLTNQTQTLSVAQLQNGMYILEVCSNQSKSLSKIIVNR